MRKTIDQLETELRSLGWAIAVHNDYRLQGQKYTFYLWTHPNGRWIKGEGHQGQTAALEDCLAQAQAILDPTRDTRTASLDLGDEPAGAFVERLDGVNLAGIDTVSLPVKDFIWLRATASQLVLADAFAAAQELHDTALLLFDRAKVNLPNIQDGAMPTEDEDARLAAYREAEQLVTETQAKLNLERSRYQWARRHARDDARRTLAARLP